MAVRYRTSAGLALAYSHRRGLSDCSRCTAGRPLAAHSSSKSIASTRTNEYALPRFGPARWLGDGTAYTTVERGAGAAGGSDIVRYDAASGARSVLISAAQLTPSGTQRALTIADYVWSDDGSKLLIFTNTQKVWRQNTRGDYWVLTLKGGGAETGRAPRTRPRR